MPATGTAERYRALVLTPEDEAVTWNGHTWPRSYCCTVVEYGEYKGPRTSVHLSCGHWAELWHRFCPHCGRAVVELA